MLKSETRALEYRAQAEAASAAAAACVLDRAREKHEAAAARWTVLAENEEGRSETGRRFLGSSNVVRAAEIARQSGGAS